MEDRENLVALPGVGGRRAFDISVDDERVVDVDKEGHLLVTTRLVNAQAHELYGELPVVLELAAQLDSFVVHLLAVWREKLAVDR